MVREPMARISYKQICINASVGAAVLGFALVSSYILFGHGLIKAIYDSDLSIRIMGGKVGTPLQAYFAAMDKGVLALGLGFMVAAVGLLLVTDPLGLLLSGTSFLIGSVVIFLLLDLFPALVKPLHFDMIPIFNYRLTYVPDPVLGFRERAFNQAQITNFRGFGYSPLYGIDVPPRTLLWQTDDEGFRNQPYTSFADVAVIGSSYIEYGNDLADTYPKKLEEKLGRLKVINLGKAGYGPFQYLEVLKRYALKKKPRYVVFAFHAPGDTDGHLAEWVRGEKNSGLAKRSIAFGGFFPRYGIALQQTWQMLISGCWTALQLGFQRIVGTEFVHPDVAVLRLPNNVTEKIFFIDRHSERSTDDLLRSPEWRALEKVLVAFKQVSEQNQIVPLMVYIPVVTEIYAEYSTLESGANWLRARESQIATSSNNEEATRRLAAKVGIELISFLPAFKEAARQGKLVYYRVDSHWNAEGREIAAKVTAEALKALETAKSSDNAKPKVEKKHNSPLRGTQQVALDERKEGVMTRTIDGKINFWNRGAEELYGWTKEEAIGKVSHRLLHTQFPEPLEQIDAQLVQTGRWEGKLVHTTRDGRRVVVESRWVLDRQGHPGAVVEINRRSAELRSMSPDLNGGMRSGSPQVTLSR
jgi:PAS domain S-box-containing protein